MADVVTFDPINLVINEINTGSYENEIDATEIYSEWKDWLLADPGTRLGYPKAFTPVGGDPITPTQALGITRFLENGWKIKPAEFSHKMTVVGNIFSREPGESIFTGTLGPYNVHTETRVSNLADAFIASLDLALLAQQATQMKYMIESLRPTGKGFGSIYYWDPVSGSNENTGLDPGNARQTFTSIHDHLITDGAGDTVYLVADVVGSTLLITESIDIVKSSVQLRGPGAQRATLATAGDCAVAISGSYCQFDGFTVLANASTESRGICIVGDHVSVENCLLSGAGEFGLYVTGAYGCYVNSSDIANNDGTGVYLGDSGVAFQDTSIRNNGGDGVQIVSTVLSGSRNNTFDLKTSLFGNVRYGMTIDENTVDTAISPGAHIRGMIIDSGSATYNGVLASEQASYVGSKGPGVFFDQVNGTPGRAFPGGSVIQPVNNFSEALSISQMKSLPRTIYAMGDYAMIDSGETYDRYRFVGEGPVTTVIEVHTSASVVGCEFTECMVTGTLDGGSVLRMAAASNLTHIDGYMHETGLMGTITLSGQNDFTMLDCWSIPPDFIPIIDCNGSGSAVNVSNFNGALFFMNKTGSEPIQVIAKGRVVLDIELDATGSWVTGSVTQGTLSFIGIGHLADRNNVVLEGGTQVLRPGLIIHNQLLSENNIVSASVKGIWDAQSSSFGTPGSYGAMISDISGSMFDPSRGVIT